MPLNPLILVPNVCKLSSFQTNRSPKKVRAKHFVFEGGYGEFHQIMCANQ